MTSSSSLDVRLPIGGRFTALGLLLASYGLATDRRRRALCPLSVNINLGWGLVTLRFGVLWLVLRTGHGLPAPPPTRNPEGECRLGLER
jgi:hypothetical protein